MNIVLIVFEAVRTITFYLVCGIALVFCYNIIGYIFGLDYPGRSQKALVMSFIFLIIMLALDNMVFSIFHVHIVNTKIALGATPDPIF